MSTASMERTAMQELVGTTAGRIWEYLSAHGPSTVLKIKASLGIPNSQLYLALGWLAREEKLEIIEFEHTYKIALRG